VCCCTRCEAHGERDARVDGFLCAEDAATASACCGTLTYLERELTAGANDVYEGEWLACDACGRVPLLEEGERRVRSANSVEFECASAGSDAFEPIASALARLERMVHPCNHRLLSVRLHAVRALRKSGARTGELALLLVAVLNALEHAPYLGLSDVAWYSALLGEACVQHVLRTQPSPAERRVCLGRAKAAYSQAIGAMLVCRGPDHSHTLTLLSQRKAVTQMILLGRLCDVNQARS
jgi:hypothetical protein